MKRFFVLMICVCLAVLPAMSAEAGCSIHRSSVVVEHVTPVVTTFAPLAVFAVPAYGVGYLPPAYGPPPVAPAPPAAASCEQVTRQLEARIAELEARLKAPVQTPPGVQPPPTVPPPAGPQATGLAIMQAKCASCHEAAVAKTKGAGFVLFTGNALRTLEGGVQAKLLKNIYSGRMPKNDKLTDEEVAEVIGFMDTLK